MKPSEKKKQLERLARFLEVIQTDTEKITKPFAQLDFMQKAVGLGYLPSVTLRIIEENRISAQSEYYNNLEEDLLQKVWPIFCRRIHKLNKAVIWILENINNRYFILFSIQQALAWGTGSFDHIKDFQIDEISLDIYDSSTSENIPRSLKTFKVSTEFIPFLQVIDNVPMEHIKHCENEKCNKFFVQTSKREKRFCSYRCQNTVAVRKSREKKI